MITSKLRVFLDEKTTDTKLIDDQMRRYLQSLNVTMSECLYYKITSTNLWQQLR